MIFICYALFLGWFFFFLQIADYYYEERMCLLRCVLLLLTYFQDERHPYRVRSSYIYVKCRESIWW